MSATPKPAPEVRTVVVVTHGQPDQTSEAMHGAIGAAKRAGAVIAAPADERAKHETAAAGLEAAEELEDQPDLCLVLGGDGTMLQALRLWVGTGVPVFGINFGTIGFLAAVEREDLDAGLERAFAGEFDVMSMPGLEIDIDIDHPVALNDVSFIRLPHGRVAELSYTLGSDELGHVRCDGLVAATPAGSTGYNLANSGPILAWGVEGYVVSFIAPHTLTARALVAAPTDSLRVANARGREPVDIVLDGAPVGRLESGAEAEITFRDGVSLLAQAPGSSFYRRMREKFGKLAG